MRRTYGTGGGGKAWAVTAAAVAVLAGLWISQGGLCSNCILTVEGAGVTPAAPLPEDADAGPAPVSRKVDLHFYLDASGSMKNFLTAPKAGQHNYFEKVLNQSGNILSESWDASVTFWRFGEGEPRQLDADGLRKFLSPAAFTDRSTHIEKAIQHNVHGPQEPARADRHPVKVILTDLWQNDNGAGDLAQRLDDAYLNQEPMAVGVLGIRSAFHGKPDLPGRADPDAADSMPFYFLISGMAPDVRFVIKHLVEDLKIADKDYFQIVFARGPADRVVHYLKVSSADKKSGISQDDRLVPGSKDKFPVVTFVRHDLKLNMEETLDQPRVTLGPYIKLSVHPKVTAMVYRKGLGAPDLKAQDELTVSGDEPRQITIHRTAMEAGAMYRFRIDLMEDWMLPLANLDSWNLESPQDMVNNRFPEDASGTRPGRTLSLRHFLNVLRLKMSQHETPLARYYLYVQTN